MLTPFPVPSPLSLLPQHLKSELPQHFRKIHRCWLYVHILNPHQPNIRLPPSFRLLPRLHWPSLRRMLTSCLLQRPRQSRFRRLPSSPFYHLYFVFFRKTDYGGTSVSWHIFFRKRIQFSKKLNIPNTRYRVSLDNGLIRVRIRVGNDSGNTSTSSWFLLKDQLLFKWIGKRKFITLQQESLM